MGETRPIKSRGGGGGVGYGSVRWERQELGTRGHSKTLQPWGALEFAKRGWRTEVAVAAYTVASESKRVTSPSVVSH